MYIGQIFSFGPKGEKSSPLRICLFTVPTRDRLKKKKRMKIIGFKGCMTDSFHFHFDCVVDELENL